MSLTTLSFTLPTVAKWKQGRFVVNNLIVKKVITGSIEFESIDLYLDNSKYDDSIESWAGIKLNSEDIFRQCINAYLRKDRTYIFDEAWSVFDLFCTSESTEKYSLKLPVFDYLNSLIFYTLDMATADSKYYSCSGDCLLLDSDNKVLTDMECFYLEALDKDLEDIAKGALKCIYMSEDVKQYNKERSNA